VAVSFITSLSEISKHFQHHDYSDIIIIVDENTRAYCLPVVLKNVPELNGAYVLEIPSGETFKNLETCQLIWRQFLEWHIDRNALLVNLGGGVISDMGGFIAAAYKRSISFINIPTTLLAMVDATTGGKTGIDFDDYKNVIGVFNEAEATFIDSGFLKTLPRHELMSGYAEMVKHALIGNATLWNEILSLNPAETKDWNPLLQKSVKVKQKIVSKDYKEKGLRKVLNFGHTIGHALESYALKKNKKLLHGHAVALGMMAESYLSFKKCGLAVEDFAEINAYLLRHFGKYGKGKIAYKSLKKYLFNDKKNRKDNLQFSLIKAPGKPVYDITCSEQDVKNALHQLRDLL
jgi:3-dehydroquinate synthase